MTFAVANIRGGMRRDLTPFLLDNDAFPVLENMYEFRGRLVRRSAIQWVGNDGRVKINLGTTNGAGAFSTTLLDAPLGTGYVQFVIGSTILTDEGTPANPIILLANNATAATLNRTTGALSIIGGPLNTAVYYFPGLPIMGLKVFEVANAINDELLLAFDTKYAYIFNQSTNIFNVQDTFVTPGTANTFVWTGQDYNLFFSCNYEGALWATNSVPGYHASVTAQIGGEGDGIRWYNGNAINQGWSNFNPALDGTTFLLGGLLIFPYKDRLVILNTSEGANLGAAVNWRQRARWSQNGTPYYTNSPAATFSTDSNAWRSDVVGRGGYVDAATSESIVAAEFIKDTLIVYFERSTWQLVYTGNETLPFIWQKINTELGCESSLSVIPFDRGTFAVGNYGIVSCDSVNVSRIDEKIPDEVFAIQNSNHGPQRVSGIRDYPTQLACWAYPRKLDLTGEAPPYTVTYPNNVLIYNYTDGTWSTFKDSITSFGYWQQFNDRTWENVDLEWEQCNFSWNSGVLSAKYPDVIAGNQRGYVFIYTQIRQNTLNDPSLMINNWSSATLTIPDHNLDSSQYVLVSSCQGFTSSNGIVYKVNALTSSTLQLLDTNGDPVIAGAYTGGGTLSIVDNVNIQTKEFNPFYTEGSGVRIDSFDILMDNTSDGELTAQVYMNSAIDEPTSEFIIDTSPEPSVSFSAQQDRIWHRVFTNAVGSFYQIVFTLSDSQIRDLTVSGSNITIQGMIFYNSSVGRLPYDV